MFDVVALFVVLVLFYGVLGTQLFSSEQVGGYDPGNDNFNDFGASALAVYILTTTGTLPRQPPPRLSPLALPIPRPKAG